MLFRCRHISISTALGRCSRQHQWTAHRLYSSKVRVYPFVLSKENAIAWMNGNVSVFGCVRPFKTWLEQTFPFLKVKGLQPARVQAAYIPTWILDGQISATVWITPPGGEPIKAWQDYAHWQYTHAELPGYVRHPLSSCRMFTKALFDSNICVPWSENLRKHDGEDVLCIPFSLSPFHLIETIRALSLSEATISKNFRFEPSTVSDLMMAAYPILVPGYFAEYTSETYVDGAAKEITLRAFMEAGPSSEVPKVTMDLGEDLAWYVKPLMNNSKSLTLGDEANYVHAFTGVSSLNLTTIATNYKKTLLGWINRAAVAGTPLSTYRTSYFGETESEATRAVDWDDIRIRPFTVDERYASARYIKTTEGIILALKVAEIKEQLRKSSPTLSRKRDSENTMMKISAMERKLEKLRPGWLEQYEDEVERRKRTKTPRSVTVVGKKS